MSDNKVQGAEARGAVGVLIYSDPRDDGSVTVENGYEPYPAGPARNPTSIQRGSVMYLSVYVGDPTTPGYPAYENATRVDVTNTPNIPSLPLSWANAKLLFEEELGGIPEGTKLNGRVGSRKVRMVNDGKSFQEPVGSSLSMAVQWTPRSHLSGTQWPQFLATSKTKSSSSGATVMVSCAIFLCSM